MLSPIRPWSWFFRGLAIAPVMMWYIYGLLMTAQSIFTPIAMTIYEKDPKWFLNYFDPLIAGYYFAFLVGIGRVVGLLILGVLAFST